MVPYRRFSPCLVEKEGVVMRLRTWAKVLFILMVVCVAVPSLSMAFNRESRKGILDDAISLCPENLKAYLEDDLGAVYEGMTFDYDTHSIADPRAIPRVYTGLMERLKSPKPDDYNTMRAFGSLAALVTEAIYPGYRSSTDDINPSVVTFDGIQQLGDPEAKAKALVDAYSPYWRDNSAPVQDSLYGVAVNEIVDFWVAAWRAAGKAPGAFQEFGQEIHRKELVLSGDAAKAKPGDQNQDKSKAKGKKAGKGKDKASASKAEKVSIPEGWIQKEKKRLKNELTRWENDYAEAKRTGSGNLASCEEHIAFIKSQMQEIKLNPEAYYKKNSWRP